MSLKKHQPRRAFASLALLSAVALGASGLIAAPAFAAKDGSAAGNLHRLNSNGTTGPSMAEESSVIDRTQWPLRDAIVDLAAPTEEMNKVSVAAHPDYQYKVQAVHLAQTWPKWDEATTVEKIESEPIPSDSYLWVMVIYKEGTADEAKEIHKFDRVRVNFAPTPELPVQRGDKLEFKNIEGVRYSFSKEPELNVFDSAIPEDGIVTLERGVRYRVGVSPSSSGYRMPTEVPEGWEEDGPTWWMTKQTYIYNPAPYMPPTPEEEEETLEEEPEVTAPQFPAPSPSAEPMLFGAGDDAVWGYRAGNMYYLPDSEDPTKQGESFAFGRASDEVTSVQTDDGSALVVVRGPEFHVSDGLGSATKQTFRFGRSGDESFIGDWDGDGKDSFAVVRGNRIFYVNQMRGGVADGDFTYGRAGDRYVVGDWDGDGKDTFGVVRGNEIMLRNSLTSGGADEVVVFE